MKKRILSLFLMLTMLFVSLPIETFAISLADKEKIYRANEWQLNSAQTVIDWLCTDDNFAHHKHTETFASKFTMFVYGVSNIDVVNMLFDNPSEYRKATKEILLSIINSNEDSMLVTTKEEVASDIIDILLKGTADYLASDGIISDASELLQSVDSHDLQQLKYIFVDGQGQEHFNNFVLDNLTADKQEAARETVRKYFKSQKYVDDLSSITDAVSVMQDMLEIAQKSLDVFVELETYRRNDDNIMHFLKYLHTNATSEHVKSVASELYISFYNTYEQNFEMAVKNIKNIVLSSATDFTMDAIIEIIENKVSVFGLFSTAAKLGIDAGKIVSDIWFNTSDTKEITASTLILDHIATDLSAYVKKCQDNFNISYDNIIINTNNAARDAGRYINAVQMLLDTRKKGENSYYALKDTIYSADMLSIVHLFGGFDDTLESLENWYTQRKADFETASNTLFYYIESSQYENKYEYVFNKETFVIEDGVLIEYNGSGDSRIGTPEEITAIGHRAFHAETLLISVNINGSPIIKSNAFDSCGDLRTVYIPKTVVSIEDNAFYNCENLTIYGYSGSVAEEYALKNSIPFVAWSVSENKTVWDGSVADGFAGGDGTKDNPYKISSGAQLAYLSKLVAEGDEFNYKYFVLTNDIYLNDVSDFENWENTPPANNWVPIGNLQNPFDGYFNGQNYTIHGIYINNQENDYQGLFGDSWSTWDLNIEKSYIRGRDYVGGITGISQYVTNCSYSGKIVGQDYIGGLGGRVNHARNCNNLASIVGRNYVGGIGGTIVYNGGEATNCYNIGNVTGNDYIGGIAGNSGRISGDFSNCYNAGDITGATYIGGIAGNSQDDEIVSSYNIGNVKGKDYVGGVAGYIERSINCYNTGSIEGANYVGGVAGYSTTVLRNSHNTGNIKGENWIAGIAGFFLDGNLDNCYNTGTIEGLDCVGGILGQNEDMFDKADNCYNTGNIKGRDYVGGIAGKMTNEDIENFYNTGNVFGESNVAGIVGYFKNTYTYGNNINNCYNTGNIEGVSYVSGIVGRHEGNSPYVQNCYNIGDVKGQDYVGGIVITYYDVENCYNTGAIEGQNYVGGIAAYQSSINNCYNSGAIVGQDYIGGIMGSNRYSVENCYNTGKVKGHDYVGGIVGDRCIVIKCYNTGAIEGHNYVGGIAGFESEIENCYNTGYVIGVDYVGGIIGQNDYFSHDIKNCYNVGTIEGENNIGGIAGDLIQGWSEEFHKIVNCYNSGVIKGKVNVGGILGHSTFFGTTSGLENCYNTGNVSGIESVSGILGCLEHYWSSADILTLSCIYNIGTIVGETDVSSIIAKYTKPSNSDTQLLGLNNVYYADGINIENDENFGSSIPLNEMRSTTAYLGFDFEEIWSIQNDINYGYPHLKELSAESTPINQIEGTANLTLSNDSITVETSDMNCEIDDICYTWYNEGVILDNVHGNTLLSSKMNRLKIKGNFHVKLHSKYHFGELTSDTINVTPTLISGNVAISGTPSINNTLTADTTNIMPVDCTLIYQWYRNGIEINEATSSTYLLTEDDCGCIISVSVEGAGIYDGKIESDSISIKEIPQNWNGFEYYVNDDQIEISGYTYNEYYIDIPISINGYLVTKIAENAFANNTNLGYMLIPDTITHIGDGAFLGCTNLYSINYIGTETQWNAIDIGNNNSVLNNIEKTFEYDENIIQSAIIDYRFTGSTIDITLGFHYAYKDCIAIFEVRDYYDDTLEKSAEYDIAKATEIKEISIPFTADDNYHSIYISFVNNIAEKVEIGYGGNISFYAERPILYEGDYSYVVNADGNAVIVGYFGNNNIIEIPSNLGEYAVTEIDEYAFAGTQIEEVVIPTSLTRIGTGAFAETPLKSITIPSSVTYIGDFAFDLCENLSNITVSNDNMQYCSVDGNLYSKDRTELIKYSTGKQDNEWIIPDTVTTIKAGALSNSKYLTAITLPNNLVSIEKYAFGNGKWKTISIPASVEEIECCAFSYCNELTNITVSANNLHYFSDDGVLFTKDKTRLIQYPLGKNETSYKVPEGVLVISSEAFTESLIQQICIPKSLKTIENWAFEVCDNLKTVFYSGSRDEYMSIDFTNGNYILLSPEEIIFEYDGMPAQIQSVHCWYDNNQVTAKIKFNYIEQTGTLILAIYDEGKFITLKDATVTIDELENTIEIGADENYKNYEAKVFYWDGYSSLKPLATAVESEIMESIWVDDVLESEHPYWNNIDETKTYTYEGECASIDVTFSDDTMTESSYDYIYIYDANNNEIGVYTGTELAGQTIRVPGNIIKIRLTSDGSVTKNGYRTESIIINK